MELTEEEQGVTGAGGTHRRLGEFREFAWSNLLSGDYTVVGERDNVTTRDAATAVCRILVYIR